MNCRHSPADAQWHRVHRVVFAGVGQGHDRAAAPTSSAPATSSGPPESVQRRPVRPLGPYRRAAPGDASRATFEAPWGIQVSPIFRYRSALPVALTEGVDLNQNGANTDLPTEAFAFDGFDSNHNPILKDIGACKTINCGRGAALSTFNLRVSKSFKLVGRSRIDAIGEVFNLFNAAESRRLHRPQESRDDHERDAESGLPASDRVLRRLPAAGAAGRPDRIPVLVLTGLDRNNTRGGASAPPFFVLSRCPSRSSHEGHQDHKEHQEQHGWS